MIIERAVLGDAEVILDLQKLCYQSEAAIYGDYQIQPLTQTIEDIRSEFTSRLFLKAADNSSIIGSVRAYLEGDTCLIGRLIVHPDFQNRGIGTQLLREIERRFPLARQFELFTGDKSAKNISLYRKIGYREFRKESPTPRLTLVYMRKMPDGI